METLAGLHPRLVTKLGRMTPSKPSFADTKTALTDWAGELAAVADHIQTSEEAAVSAR